MQAKHSAMAAAVLFRKDQGGEATADPKALATEIKRISDETTKFAEKAVAEIKANAKISEEVKATVDQLLTDRNTLIERLKQIEAEIAMGVGKGGDPVVKSAGQTVVESDEFKAMAAAKGGRVSIAVKALLSAGFSVPAQRVPGINALPDERPRIRSLLMPGRTTSSAIEFVRETGFTNGAAIVAEQALKPESNITFELLSRNVVTIAHWLQASKQILDDAPQLQSFIDYRLRYGLTLVEDVQLLKGSGTAGNLEGIYTVASAYAAPGGVTVANETAVDRLRLALLQAELAGYPANGIVLSPIDWAVIELLKTTDGAYLFANPQGSIQPRLWGTSVVSTVAMDQGDFLTGAFSIAAQVFDREDANVVISTEDRDNFIRNMVTIRAEERLALVIYRPEAFVKGELPA